MDDRVHWIVVKSFGMHCRLLLHQVEFNGEHEVGRFSIFPLPFQSISQGIERDYACTGLNFSSMACSKVTLGYSCHDYYLRS